MSKPVKELLRKELASRLEGVGSLAVVGFSGVDAVTTHAIRKRLLAKKITPAGGEEFRRPPGLPVGGAGTRGGLARRPLHHRLRP